jgi:hypothetical protein
MRTTNLFVLVPTFISAWLLPSCAAAGPTPTATAAEPARITVLYDAFGKDATMTKDRGYAALVEINGKRILFDTGDDPAILAKNVKAKGVDLTKLDFVVLSHRHSDHVGGLSYLLSVKKLLRACMIPIKSITSPRVTAPENQPSLLCNGCLAIVIFMPDWVQRWALAPSRASNLIVAPP